MHASRQRNAWRALPAGIWAMGFGSLFMDMSSELIHSVLPVFMVSVLGVSMVTVGVIEGVAEATAAFLKVFSGALSDHLGKRKALMVFGYGLAAATKPVFPLAASIEWIFAARFLDRIGKGIRGAPRDALIADLVAPALRGSAYGLRQALDSTGAVLGPLAAIALMLALGSDLRTVMWFAVVPAAVAVILFVFFLHEPRTAAVRERARMPLMLRDVSRLPRRFWMVVSLGVAFTLARFSEAFLILRAADVGLAAAWLPAMLITMNLCYAAGAFPAGIAADRMSARMLLVSGLVLLIVADCLLAVASSVTAVLAGAALWGLHMALTQGLLSKLVADSAPARLLGTAFGLFHLMSGVALLLASLAAGLAWSALGAPATFMLGAAFATAAIALALVLRPQAPSAV